MPWCNLSLDDLPDEIWVDAYGFDGIYEVSNMGRIKSLSRLVPNGKSERLVKERIRKQVMCNDGRLTCPLHINNKSHSINVSALIYYSFHRDSFVSDKECIMHKNKLASDNRLSNLCLEYISNSHKLNFKKGLLPHLYKNNMKKHEEYLCKSNKKCNVCGIIRPISEFEPKRSTCTDCRSKYRHSKYIERKNK